MQSMIKTVFEDEDLTLVLEKVDVMDKVFIHSDVKSWSLSKYKKYIQVFVELLDALHEEGIDELYAIPPSEKEEKWQELFGFKDAGLRAGPYKIMVVTYGN